MESTSLVAFPSDDEPHIKRSGDDFVAEWPLTHPYLAIRFRNLYEDKQGVHAELAVLVNLPAWPKRPEWGRLNLMAATTRAQTARRLAEQWQGPGSPSWTVLLTDACASVVTTYREGEPFTFLSPDSGVTKPEYALYPILPKNRISTLFGDGASGKGLIALSCALSIQEGGDLLDVGSVAEPGTGLYLDYEADEDEQNFRLQRLAAGFGLASWKQMAYRQLFQPLHQEAAAIRRFVDDHHVTFVVLDSLGAAVGADLNDAHEIIRVWSIMRSFRCTVLVIDHTSKGDSQGRATGSNYKYHYSRAIWETKKATDAGSRELRVALLNHKMNNGPLSAPVGFRFAFDGDDGAITTERFDVRGDDTLAANATVPNRIMFILRQRPVRFPELLEELRVATPDLKENTVTQAVKRLRDQRRVSVAPDGRYGLTAT